MTRLTLLLLLLLLPSLLLTPAVSTVYTGFNYGAFWGVPSNVKKAADFRDNFDLARNLNTGTPFNSARLFTCKMQGTIDTPTEAFDAAELSALAKGFKKHGKNLSDLVIGLSVGSEDVYRFEDSPDEVGVSAKEISAAIGSVKEALKGPQFAGYMQGKPVGHVDTAKHVVIEGASFYGMTAYPYWNKEPIEKAKDSFFGSLDNVKRRAGNTPIYIAEMGWPYEGPQLGEAVASQERLQDFWTNVGCEVIGKYNMFWFELIKDSEAGQPDWGILDPTTYEPRIDLSCPGLSGPNMSLTTINSPVAKATTLSTSSSSLVLSKWARNSTSAVSSTTTIPSTLRVTTTIAITVQPSVITTTPKACSFRRSKNSSAPALSKTSTAPIPSFLSSDAPWCVTVADIAWNGQYEPVAGNPAGPDGKCVSPSTYISLPYGSSITTASPPATSLVAVSSGTNAVSSGIPPTSIPQAPASRPVIPVSPRPAASMVSSSPTPSFPVSNPIKPSATSPPKVCHKHRQAAINYGVSSIFLLNQLRDLITPQPGFISAHNTSIFNPTALADIHSALHHCRSIFSQIKRFLERATKQVKDLVPRSYSKVTLSRSEKAKWPFLQASVQELRNDLRDSKTNLLLMVAVANLAMARRRGHSQRFNPEEQADLKATIVKIQRMNTLDVNESDNESEEEKEHLIKRLMQKLGLRKGGRKEQSGDDADDNKGLPPTATGIRHVTLSEKIPEQGQTADAAAAFVASAPPSHRSGGTNGPAVENTPTEDNQLQSEQMENKLDHGDETTMPDIKPTQGQDIGHKDGVSHVVDLDEILSSEGTDQEMKHEARFVDVAVQTLAEKEVPQDQLPFMTPTGLDTPARVQGVEQALGSNLPHESIPTQQKSPNAPKSPIRSISNREKPITVNGQKPSSVSNKAETEVYLQAWVSSALPGLTSGFGTSLGVMEVSLSEMDIRTLLQKQEAHQDSISDVLNQLNTFQRHIVLAHTRQGNSKLLHIDMWHKERIATVFGLLEIVTLMWVTSSPERRDEHVKVEALYDEQIELMSTGNGKGKAKASGASKAEVESSEDEEPLYFKDAVGRKFIFPFQLIKSWKGMEELVKQAFLHVDVIGPHVQEGHYDLVDSNSKIILPQTWSHLVQPGWEITMHMWPMPEPPAPRHRPQPPPPPPPPPPEAAQFLSQHLPIGNRPKMDSLFPRRHGGAGAPPPPPPPGMAMPPPPPPPAQIYIPPIDHGYLRHSTDGKGKDMNVLKWMAGMAGPGLRRPQTRIKKEEDVVMPYRTAKGKGKSALKSEDRIVDDLLLKWTV
ncbi:hypothetical protein DE146DRAFT_752730 [Phaeosphaeria sp. MPI-PUGE-AT-0046c]|nr:hypothetical protein DE146DRAFT_752730 [Phaeosphaeria sp. MPI-PUGE-AT-0046c]